MQGNLERALQLSKEASTGDQMALIARTLHCERVIVQAALWSMFSPVFVPVPPGDRRLAMLYLEGLPNTVDIVCYEGEKILRVLDEWLISCRVSLPHTLERQTYAHTHHVYAQHKHLLVSIVTVVAMEILVLPFSAFLCRRSLSSSCTTRVTPDATSSGTTKFAIRRALSP